MRLGSTGYLLVLFCLAGPCMAQYQSASENLLINGKKASTWASGGTSVVQVEGPLTITTERAKMSAQRAVIWLSPAKDTLIDEQKVEIALIGDAKLDQPNAISRSGDRLYVDSLIRGTIRITADVRAAEDQSQTDLYKLASTMRPLAPQTQQERQQAAHWLLEQSGTSPIPQTQPTTAPSTQAFRPAEPVHFSADETHTELHNGLVVIILSGRVVLVQHKANGAVVQMQADRAVLYTPMTDLRKAQGVGSEIENSISGVYLEGDVRLTQLPAEKHKDDRKGIKLQGVKEMAHQPPEQRLLANRVYYDTTTDRAVLTDVVVHTFDTRRNLPIVMRAELVRQLSKGEMLASNATLTSSLFAEPSYSIGAESVYTRQVPQPDNPAGTETTFQAKSTTLRVGTWPIFYWPVVGGVVNEREQLREIKLEQAKRFGLSLTTKWGVFETLGQIPPDDVDLTYSIDYFSKRGPAIGFDGKYIGGFQTDLTKQQPWTFSGDFDAFLIYDTGTDQLGKNRLDVEPPSPWRGRIWWEHQQFLPDDWQVQLTLSYLSDATFFEEWYPDQFNETPPRTTSLYAKHQVDNEAVTFLYSLQFNNFPTASETQQEQAEIERVPQVGYYLLGQGVASDSLTFFSANTATAIRFQRSHSDIVEQGFGLNPDDFHRDSPGIPSYGQTGQPSELVYRGDFREELDFPFSAGEFRVMPYAMARFIPYSDSPGGGSKQRIYAGAGLRLATTFWKTDDTASSNMFDIHRLRHVVQPEINFFVGAENVKSNDVFIYDQEVDAINDLTAVQFALHQRWQTKRGGAGRWRNVDVFTLNMEANFFAHRPGRDARDPADFRGLYFASMPEASIPRNSINADASWLISDSTVILSDLEYNLDEKNLATASILLGVKHDPRLTYAIGFRYIGEDFTERVNGPEFVFDPQKLFTFDFTYQLTTKYDMELSESYDFGTRGNIRSSATITRKFDRFYLGLIIRVDKIGQDNLIGINFYPEGLTARHGSAALRSAFGS